MMARFMNICLCVLVVVLMGRVTAWAEPVEQHLVVEEDAVTEYEPVVEEDPIDGYRSGEADSDNTPPAEPEEAWSPSLVGWIELSGFLRDRPEPYAWMAAEDRDPTLRDVVQQLERVAQDDRFAGLVIYLDEAYLNLAQIHEITQGIKAVREAGRLVLVYAQQYDLLGYALASAADMVLLQHKGLVELTGLSVEEMYLAGLLEKLGVKADFLQIGQFKGAQEPLTRSGPSDAWNQNIEALLDDVYTLILDRIADGRGISRDEVEGLLAQCWTLSDEQYVACGLVDRLADREMTQVTGDVFGDDFEWEDLFEQPDRDKNMDNPFAVFRMLFQEPRVQVRRASLAVIHASGPITSGESQPEGAFGGGSVGSQTIIRALNQALDNKRIKGVVLRVDSPGGSALASEMIWQAVRRVGQEKPVYISIGSMAASGGYYIACAGQDIFVSPGSLIGSIGVVGGKFILGGLYEKIGVSVYRRSRGPLGDMFNSVESFTPVQRAAIESAFKRTYEQFTNRVAIGRQDRIADIESVAQGRMFTGRQAVSNGLVDRIGGIDAALSALAKQVGLEPDQYDVINLPPPRSLSDLLEEMFAFPGARSVSRTSVMVDAAREALGHGAWGSVRPVLAGLMLMRHEPVLTLLPVAIVIR